MKVENTIKTEHPIIFFISQICLEEKTTPKKNQNSSQNLIQKDDN